MEETMNHYKVGLIDDNGTLEPSYIWETVLATDDEDARRKAEDRHIGFRAYTTLSKG
jgi:hypothetical protein